jgi:hypothetical protein
MDAPVFEDAGSWFFWFDDDVTFDGPFDSEEEAIAAWQKYKGGDDDED